jgi:hypothetical protein
MTVWCPQDTLEFLEHCHALGAAGIQEETKRVQIQNEVLDLANKIATPMSRGSKTVCP